MINDIAFVLGLGFLLIGIWLWRIVDELNLIRQQLQKEIGKEKQDE